MCRRNLINLLLLLAVVGLGLTAWYEPGHKPPPEAPKLLQLTPKAVTRVRILRTGQPEVKLVRKKGSWRMVEPVAAPANGDRIKEMLERATRARSLGSSTAKAGDLKRFGLAPPRITLYLNDTELAFGDNTPLDQRRYVKLGDRIHRISDLLYYRLTGSYTDFIDPHLLPRGTEVVGLTLPGLTLTQKAGRWVAEPAPKAFSADDANRLAEAWQRSEAMAISPVLDKVTGEPIDIQLAGEKKPLRFLITARKPELVLVRPDLGLAYHLTDSSAGELLALPTTQKKTNGGH